MSESLPPEWRRVAVVEEGNEEGILRIARIYYSRVRVSGSGDVFGVKSFITKGNNRALSVFLDLDFDLFHDSLLSSSSRDLI